MNYSITLLSYLILYAFCISKLSVLFIYLSQKVGRKGKVKKLVTLKDTLTSILALVVITTGIIYVFLYYSSIIGSFILLYLCILQVIVVISYRLNLIKTLYRSDLFGLVVEYKNWVLDLFIAPLLSLPYWIITVFLIICYIVNSFIEKT